MRFRLLADHLFGDAYLEEGTEVGTGTQVPWPQTRFFDQVKRVWVEGPMAPSMHMEPLDDEAEAAYAERMARMPGGVPVEIMQPPKNSPAPTGQGPRAKADSTVALNLPGQGPRTATGAVATKG